MQRLRSIFFVISCIFLLPACNTLYNTRTIEIEIAIPGEAKIPADYKKIAIKYNNCNAAFNKKYSKFFEDSLIITDSKNTDSIAAELYFNTFSEFIKSQKLYDTVLELEKSDFESLHVNDSLIYNRVLLPEKNDSNAEINYNPEALRFFSLLKQFKPDSSAVQDTVLFDPEYGVYTRKEIEQIADKTGADLLLSFDFFETADGIITPKYKKINWLINDDYRYFNPELSAEIVYLIACWNVYDLRFREYVQSYQKVDTITWYAESTKLKFAKEKLPPRFDAVMNAANLAGSRLAEFVSPHWIPVSRIYYHSGHYELKKTDRLIDENRWMEAAQIWKRNISNKNKSIAAKCMFNLAVACEINGDFDAALDWAIKSFYMLQNKNEFHQQNCNDYIKILAQRKKDIQQLSK